MIYCSKCGKPLDDEDIYQIKEKLGLYQTPFTASLEVVEDLKTSVKNKKIKQS